MTLVHYAKKMFDGVELIHVRGVGYFPPAEHAAYLARQQARTEKAAKATEKPVRSFPADRRPRYS